MTAESQLKAVRLYTLVRLPNGYSGMHWHDEFGNRMPAAMCGVGFVLASDYDTLRAEVKVLRDTLDAALKCNDKVSEDLARFSKRLTEMTAERDAAQQKAASLRSLLGRAAYYVKNACTTGSRDLGRDIDSAMSPASSAASEGGR